MKRGLTLVELLTIVAIAGILLAVALPMFFGGCQQVVTKGYGGTMTLKLEPGQKLVNCTWKETELWYLVTARATNEAPREYRFQEKSTLGLMQGTVIIKEQ